MLDLIVLTADGQQAATIETLLLVRHQTLGIRPITYKVAVEPGNDPAVYRRGCDYLRGFIRQSSHALVIIDHEFSGAPATPEMLRDTLRNQLLRNGWDDGNCEVIVIVPELEAWVWAENSPVIAEALGFSWQDIRNEAYASNYWRQGDAKPRRPKELLTSLLRRKNDRPNVGLFREVAERLERDSLRRCTDPAFNLLRDTLMKWFPR